MNHWVILDEIGNVAEGGYTDKPPIGAIWLPKGVRTRDVLKKRYVDGQWVTPMNIEDKTFDAERIKKERAREFSEIVNDERDRRLARGTDLHLEGYGWVALQGRLEDQSRIAILSQLAKEMVDQGAADATIPFRDRNNVIHNIAPKYMVMIFVLGSRYVSSIAEASWAIKEMESPPDDVSSNDLWPKRTHAPVED